MNNQVVFERVLFFLFFFLVVSGDPESVTAPMEKTELEALFMAVKGFVGSWWNGSELYPDPCGWTPIQGISCDIFNELWYVTSMSIGPVLDNSLVCSPDAVFTTQLFQLTHLKTLSFFNCFTNTEKPCEIPTENWENLAGTLETLEFRSNPSLRGPIPRAIGRLHNLQSLVLFDNALSGELPLTLAFLSRLRRLSLSSNGISGDVPMNFGRDMNDLLILDLSNNSMTGSVPPLIGNLNSLLKLDLSRNMLAGELPSELGELKNLTLLDLSNNNFSGGLPTSISRMGSIENLILSQNHHLGGNLNAVEWKIMKNLIELEMSSVGLIGEIPDSLLGLKKLRSIALDNNYLSGNIPAKLAVMPALEALFLNGNNFSGELGFPPEFLRKMGRKLASWGNPKLCFNVDAIPREIVPFGVKECKNGDDEFVAIEDSDRERRRVSQVEFGSSGVILLPTQTSCWFVVLGFTIVVVM